VKIKLETRVTPKSRNISGASLEKKVQLTKGQDVSGSSLLEQSLPRYEDDSPFIFELRYGENFDKNREALVNEIVSLELDVIIGVDGGGDSISGGVEHHGDPNLGKDIQMKKILNGSGVPFYHVVVGLCVDGETSFEDMVWHLERNKEFYKGFFSVTEQECLDAFETYCGPLSMFRTPNIVLRGYYEELYKTKKVESVYLKDVDDYFVEIDRGCHPKVPRSWIINAFVFQYGEDIPDL